MKDGNFDVSEAEEANEDEEEEDVVDPAGVPPLPDSLDVADVEEAPADGELFARVEVPSGSIAVRGLGTESFLGRVGARLVRARKGLRIPPERWRKNAAKQMRDALTE